MLHVYDLYDLSKIFVYIREYPEYKLNGEIVSAVINVLENRQNNHEFNQFRIELQKIPSLDREMYKFAFVENKYTYLPSSLKNEYIYLVLIECCNCLLEAVQENKEEKIWALADCLHNLPIFIVENKFTIPKDYWKHEVTYYRKNWDKNFLVKIQKRKP